MHVRETFCVFTLFVVCINIFLYRAMRQLIINSFLQTIGINQRLQILVILKCAHSLTAFFIVL